MTPLLINDLVDPQNMRLVIDIGDGKTVEIPLKGHLALHNFGRLSQADPSEAPVIAAAAGESGDAEAMKNLKDMRGWIMTVATLFVGMSFQALSQRPSWMPDPKDGLNLYLLGKYGGNSSDPAEKEARRVIGYVLVNTVTFSVSLVVVVVLLLPNFMASATWTLRTVKTLMIVLTVIVATNFSLMVSRDTRIMYCVLLLIILFALVTVGIVSWINWLVVRRGLLRRSSFHVRRVRSDRVRSSVL